MPKPKAEKPKSDSSSGKEAAVRAEISELIKNNPSLKPKEIFDLYKKKHSESEVSVQKVTAIKRTLALPAPTKTSPKTTPVTEAKEKPSDSKTPKLVVPQSDAPLRLKNSRTQEVQEYKGGQPFWITFPFPGFENRRFSTSDFMKLVEKNCAEFIEVEPGKEIREIPLSQVSLSDIKL
jgi:hypothetical protein